MYRIGIDVGSTYTKYCIMEDDDIISLFYEKSPIRQKEHFQEVIKNLMRKYPYSEVFSCGYGKKNVPGMKNVNELTALARGCFFCTGNDGAVLDIGGQDTKLILQEEGKLKEFFINDKCAAGSGMFLKNVLDMIGISFEDIDLNVADKVQIKLTSTCAVFAQSEIVKFIAENRTEEEILNTVISQILIKAKPLLGKVDKKSIILTGGLSQLKGISLFAENVLGVRCTTVENGMYIAAIGCAVK